MADQWNVEDEGERTGEGASQAGLPVPWESDSGDDDKAPGPRQRHDAFTPARRRQFLRALAGTGRILAACRAVAVSSRTVYNHQNKDAEFAGHCTLAIRLAARAPEPSAWQRAVEGVEEQFACGGRTHVRRRYSDSMLRLLLQASNPEKYGTRPGFTRKRPKKGKRKRIERDIRDRIARAAEAELPAGAAPGRGPPAIPCADREVREARHPYRWAAGKRRLNPDGAGVRGRGRALRSSG